MKTQHKKIGYLKINPGAQKAYDTTIASLKKVSASSPNISVTAVSTVKHYIDIALHDNEYISWVYAAGELETLENFFENKVLFHFMKHCPIVEIRVIIAKNAIEQIMKKFASEKISKQEFLSYRLIYLSSDEKTNPAYFQLVVNFLKEQGGLSDEVLEKINDIEYHWAKHFPPSRRKKTHSYSNRSNKHLSTDQINRTSGGAKKNGKKGTKH